MRWIALAPLLFAVIAAGCGDKPPTPAQAKSNAVGKLEKMHAALTEQVKSGKVPAHAKSMGKESSVLAGSLANTPAGATAKQLYDQVGVLESLLEKNSELKTVDAALREIGTSIADLKSKL